MKKNSFFDCCNRRQQAARARADREWRERVRRALERLPEMEDAAIIETLTRVKGVGVWTVHMFLIFALRRTNVLPIGDLGIRAAIRKAYGFAELPKPAEIEVLGQRWHPYCTVAAWYLWRSLEPNANL